MTEPAPSGPARADALAQANLHAQRLPVLDGLRGLAILLVMLYHQCLFSPASFAERSWYALARSGWVGVDLFFVLSGFLITGILLDTRSTPGFLKNFYARRTLRILPLYYLLLLFFFVLLPWLHARGLNSGPAGRLAGEYVEAAQHQVWYWLHLSNIYFARSGWLNHGIPNVFWSLSIEEQFYIAWPLIVMAVGSGVSGRRRLAWLSLLVLIGSLAFRLAALHTGMGRWMLAHFVSNDYQPLETFVFNATPGRLDGLAVGAALACVARNAGLHTLRPFAWATLPIALAALAALAWGQPRLDEYTSPVQGLGFSIIALACGALLVIAATAGHDALTSRLLLLRPLRSLGKYAYAMYLFHFTIQSVLRTIGLGPDRLGAKLASPLLGQFAFHVVAIATTFLAAWTSWHLLEKHCLKLKGRFQSPNRAQE